MDIPVDMSMGGIKLIRDREVCGTCKYHEHIYASVRKYEDIKVNNGWMCMNELSENQGYYTEYSDSCDDWEEK